MNIEESVKEIEKIKEIFIHLRNYGWINDIKKDINTDNAIQAIDTLLTAYEKEKEKAEYENELRIKYQKRYDSVKEKLEKEKETSHYNQSQLDIANAKLVEEKEKNKKARYYIYDALNNDDIINVGIDDMKIILDMLEE